MPKLPVVSGRETVAALKRIGFFEIHTRGSHVRLGNAAGRRMTVPVHAGHTIPPGTLRDIIRQAGLSVEEFIELLK